MFQEGSGLAWGWEFMVLGYAWSKLSSFSWSGKKVRMKLMKCSIAQDISCLSQESPPNLLPVRLNTLFFP